MIGAVVPSLVRLSLVPGESVLVQAVKMDDRKTAADNVFMTTVKVLSIFSFKGK